MNQDNFNNLSIGYQDVSSQKNMLMDLVRTKVYYNAITNNPNSFRDKVILDIGSGSGILAMYCAKAGAKKVYSVEMSKMANIQRELIKRNKLEDKIILINDNILNINLPEKVDVIISEWMGVFLFHERMLETVVDIRDKYLKPDGEMFPSSGNLCFSLYQGQQETSEISYNIDFFNRDLFGLDMSYLKEFENHIPNFFITPLIKIVKPDELIGKTYEKYFNFKTVKKEDFTEFTMKINSNVDMKKVTGVAFWFDVFFEGKNQVSILSTSPMNKGTHWQHGVLLIPQSENNELTIEFQAKKTCGYYISINKHLYDTDTFYIYPLSTPHHYFE